MPAAGGWPAGRTGIRQAGRPSSSRANMAVNAAASAARGFDGVLVFCSALLPQQLQILRADELPHGRHVQIAVELADELDGQPGQFLVAGAARRYAEGVRQPGVLVQRSPAGCIP